MELNFNSTMISSRNTNLIFVCCIFSNRKKKKLKCQAIVLDLLNYISTSHSGNLHTYVVHPNLTFFHRKPPLNSHHLKIFIFFILDNITLSSSHLERNKIRAKHIKVSQFRQIKIPFQSPFLV
jgi:hypothetical protein